MKFCIDVGGSRTRISDGTDRSVFDSALAIAPYTLYVNKDITYPMEDVFIEKDGGEPVRVLKGEAMGMYSVVPVQCENDQFKSQYPGTVYNTLLGIARLLPAQVAVSPKIMVCLPPEEAFGPQRDVFKQSVSGEYIITSAVDPDIRYKITLSPENVKVAAEGVIALSAMSNIVGLRTGCVVVVDVGYRSTDITFFVNGKPIGGCYASKPIGGINIISGIKSEMGREGKFLMDEECARLLTTGMYHGSKSYIPVVDFVFGNFAQQLRRHITDTGNIGQINAQSITAIVPIGRPFSKVDGIEPLSTLLQRKFGPGVKLVEFDGDLELANILGCEAQLNKL